MTELIMSGHDRTYLPPRSLRQQVGSTPTAWELLGEESEWAHKTLDSVLASIDSEADDVLGCTDCEDTGFYGLVAAGNDDLLVGLLRRVGTGAYESLSAGGIWEEWVAEDRTVELLTLELAEDLSGAITAGAPGLIRKYCWPLAFLEPEASLVASPMPNIRALAAAGDFFAVVDDDDPGAVMSLVRVDQDSLTAFGLDGWNPWDPDPEIEYMAIPLDQDSLSSIQKQMTIDLIASALLADAPLTVSPNPKAEKLRRYWATGKGGAKIRWNTGSDWRRCYRHLKKYMGLRAKGYCNNLHRRNTGMWTGDRRNRGFLRGSAASVDSGTFLQVAGSAQPGPIGSVHHIFRVGEIVSFTPAEAGSEVPTTNILAMGHEFQVSGIDVTAMETEHISGTGRIQVMKDVVHLVPVGNRPDVDLPGSSVSQPISESSRGVAVSVPVEGSGPPPASIRQDVVIRLETPHNKFRSPGQPTPSVMQLAQPCLQASGDTFVVVDGTSHAFYCTHSRCGWAPESAPIEQQIVASLQSGLWTGEPERNSDMAEAAIKDGIYCEVDDNAGLLATLTAGGFPVAPPDEWYDNPNFTGPTPMEVEDDGRVRGHIATFDVTHIGMAGAVHAPRNSSGYKFFLTGALKTASGKQVNVGQLTLAGGHAPLHASAPDAVRHYDDTNSAVADVTVGEDQYGIWAAGSLRPNITPEQVRVFRASPLSGDWRPINGNLELVAACAVNVPGFPTARALAAGGAIVALVAAGARPLAERRAAMTADAQLLERLDAIEAQVFPKKVFIGENEVTSTEPVAASTITVTEEPPAAAVVEEVAAPVVEAEAEVVAEAEAAVVEAAADPVEAQEAAEQNTPDEVQPEVADKLDPEQLAQVREDAKALKRDLLRREVHGVTAGSMPPQFVKNAAKKSNKSIPETERKGIGGYPIKDAASLKDAIQAVGRAKPADRAKTIAHIKAAAAKLGLTKLLPSTPGW